MKIKAIRICETDREATDFLPEDREKIAAAWTAVGSRLAERRDDACAVRLAIMDDGSQLSLTEAGWLV